MRLLLGNMPAHSKAVVRAFCAWKLDVQDESYCLRIPMTYVPRYMGNQSNLPSLNRTDPQDLSTDQLDKLASLQNIAEVEEMPVKLRASGLWDFQIKVHGQGELERIASLNHPIQVTLSPDKTKASVCLKSTVDRSLVPNSDFVLYIRDLKMAQPTVVSTLTPSMRQAISVQVIPDSRSDAVK